MIITCEECQTKFRVADELIKRTGTRVRCSNCQSVFTVFRPVAAPNQEDNPLGDLDRPDHEFPTTLDQELAGLFANDEPTATQPSRGSVPIIVARPPYPAGANQPLTPPIVISAPPKSPPAPIPAPPKAGGAFDDLGLDDDPVFKVSKPPPQNESAILSQTSPQGQPASTAAPNESHNLTSGPSASNLDPLLDHDPNWAAGGETNPNLLANPSDVLPPRNPELWAPKDETVSDNPLPPRLSDRERNGRRGRVFFLVVAVVIAFLVIGLLFLSIWRKPASIALQTPDLPPTPSQKQGAVTDPKTRPSPPKEPERLLLDFVQDRESHHYRVNKSAGRVLIITGLVTNGYPHPRSFIRIKGSLRDSRDEVVAERQVFAGNYLTEDELINLPMPEILARLALKGGQDNDNVRVPPQKAIPFMLVFDRLPDDLAAYILEPVGSVPTDSSPTNPG